jgi:hypothetical protein
VAPESEVQVALALLEFPELAKLVSAGTLFSASPSGVALKELWAFLADSSQRPNMAQVSERFRDTPHMGLIEAAIQSPAYGKNADYEASRRDVEAYVQRVAVEHAGAKTQDLVGVDVSSLSATDRETLLEGLRKKAEFDENLDRENRSKH